MEIFISPARKMLFMFLVLFFFSILPIRSDQDKNQKIPESQAEIYAMERKIWMLLNEERAFDGLPPLELSPALSDLARKHSRDMADQELLTHRSSSGFKLADRLEKAGITYIEAGENVAFSETFVAEFIHEHLIESPEHRENILDPDFHQVGIGIVYKKDEGYYVTQDFLRPLIPKTEQEVKSILRNNLNIRRKALSVSPLDFLDHRESFAQDFSRRKASGTELPAIPEAFGETLIIFMASPSLSDESTVFREALNPHYDQASLGVWFAKNEKYPGGAYFITLMLFAAIKHSQDSPSEWIEIILAQINTVRLQKGFKKLKLNERLTARAKEMVAEIAGWKTSPAQTFPASRRYEILSYGTEDLQRLPEILAASLNNSALSRIGIGILFKKNRSSDEGTFWVTLVFE